MMIKFYDGYNCMYENVRKVKKVHERLGPACSCRGEKVMINVGNKGVKILEDIPLRYVIDDEGDIYQAYKHNGRYHEFRYVCRYEGCFNES